LSHFLQWTAKYIISKPSSNLGTRPTFNYKGSHTRHPLIYIKDAEKGTTTWILFGFRSSPIFLFHIGHVVVILCPLSLSLSLSLSPIHMELDFIFVFPSRWHNIPHLKWFLLIFMWLNSNHAWPLSIYEVENNVLIIWLISQMG
jgi:hypothetical protein